MEQSTNPKENFEQAITELESIVTLLEKGDLSLDDTLKHYEKGMKLAQFCQTALNEAQKKVEQFKSNQEQNEDDINK